MQYNQECENVNVMDSIDIPGGQPLLLSDHSEIKQIRQFLMILICICLGFAVVYLIMSIIGWAVTDGLSRKDERLQIIEAIISILFYGFGLLVTYKYHQKGLRVYGWLGIILVIITVIGIIVYHLLRVKLFYQGYPNFVWIVFTYVTYIINVWFHMCAITVVMIKFAFKLARLMDTNGQFIARH